VNLLLGERTSAVWEQGTALVGLNYAAISVAVVLSLWGARTIARRLEDLQSTTADVLVGEAISVGWLGAVGTVRGVYLVMKPATWLVLVPLALALLLTGLIQALGTPWGLFRHYWVVFKLLINVLATVVLLAYMRTFDSLARVAGNPSSDLDTVRNVSPLLHASLAFVLLLVATILATYKPRGVTRYGRRFRPAMSRRTKRTGPLSRSASRPADCPLLLRDHEEPRAGLNAIGVS
jgi:hypothetical protein